MRRFLKVSLQRHCRFYAARQQTARNESRPYMFQVEGDFLMAATLVLRSRDAPVKADRQDFSLCPSSALTIAVEGISLSGGRPTCTIRRYAHLLPPSPLRWKRDASRCQHEGTRYVLPSPHHFEERGAGVSRCRHWEDARYTRQKAFPMMLRLFSCAGATGDSCDGMCIRLTGGCS